MAGDAGGAARTGGRRGCVTRGFDGFAPDACLINRYEPGAQLSLHQDKDELDFAAPIVSVSLGLPAIFLFGGPKRADKPRRYRLEHGDVVVWGGPSRLFFHGVAPLADGEHAVHGPPAHQSDFSQGAVTPSPLWDRAFHLHSHGLCSQAQGRHDHIEVTSETSASANRTGVYLAVLQLVFTLGWTTYVIYLPKLCRRGRHRAVGGDPDPDAGSGDLHHHRHRDGHCRRPDRAVRRQARRVRRRR